MRFVRQLSENTPRGHTRDAIKRMILARGYQVGDKLPTYRDLAQHFGVALFTVERVMKELAGEGMIHLLHGKGAFIKQLPAPDGQLRQVGLIYTASRMHLIRTGYLNEILAGLVQTCDKQQIDLQILSFWRGGGQHVPVPPHETAVRIDGAILLGIVNEAYIAQFVREEVPLVLVDGQSRTAGVHSITVDNAMGVDQVMDHLHGLGHRRIAYVDTRNWDILAAPESRWVDSADTRERREAYLAAMSRLGIAEHARIFETSSLVLEETVARTVEFVRQEPSRPTALLVYDADTAGGICQGLCRAGVRVPEDVSVAGVIGVRNQPAVGTHTLTFGRVLFETMGRRAMQILAAQAAGEMPTEPRVDRISAELSVGTTTAGARG